MEYMNITMNHKTIGILVFSLILSIWGVSFYRGIETAVGVWSVSEIFTHCFLIIPGAFYLIFQKREALFHQEFKANYWLAFPLIAISTLYVFGVIGDIRLFMHIATFTSLPLFIWMFIGNKAVHSIAFPLYFMLFAIPVGDQLIPYLQELTTDIAVPLIELSGVPIYRNGLYLDIPAGRFLVAEACSGISFLIASIVFGNLYAYLSFKTLSKQLVFVVTSIIVPILANAIRVYGIVVTAHLTDMEYAAGADHLIYGGVFYAIVLFLLIVIGEKFRDKKRITNIKSNVIDKESSYQYWPVSLLLVVIFSSQNLWISNIKSNHEPVVNHSALVNIDSLRYEINQKELVKWKPHFPYADNIQQGHINIDENTKIDFFSASYGGHEGELISSTNKFYYASRWSLINTRSIRLNNQSKLVKLTHLVSPLGKHRWIIHWYILGDFNYINKVEVKLNQTLNLLFGKVDRSGVVAFSIETDRNDESVLIQFLEKISNIDSVTKQVIEDK
jgi:exosortase A